MKKVFTLLLLLFLISSTSLAFAYWAGAFTGDNETTNETVIIGEAEDATALINVSLDNQTTGTLVPPGRAVDSTGTPVEEVIILYDITWVTSTGNPAGILGTLNIEESNILIDGDATYANLINITVSPTTTNITVDGTAVTVTITVTLTEPSNQAEYNAIAGKNITFDLLFEIDPN